MRQRRDMAVHIGYADLPQSYAMVVKERFRAESACESSDLDARAVGTGFDGGFGQAGLQELV